MGTFSNQLGEETARECMAAAYEAGVNFFDNAEVYAGGKSEEVMGAVLKKMGWRRGSYLVPTKFFWVLHDSPNEKNTLNRKRLLEAMDGSLMRMQLWATAVNEADSTFKSAEELRTIYEGKGIKSDGEVIAYCRIGERSSLTWFVLKYLLGYPNVKNYDGSCDGMGQPCGCTDRKVNNVVAG